MQESCDLVRFAESTFSGRAEGTRTVMDTFGDCLENFDVQGCSASVVPIVFVFFIADDAFRTLTSGKLDGGPLRYPRNDLTGIERNNGPVRIDGIRVQDLWKVHGFEHRFGEVRCERVFVRTANGVSGGSARARQGICGSSHLVYLRAFDEKNNHHGQQDEGWKATERTEGTNRWVLNRTRPLPWKASVSLRNHSSQLPLISSLLSSSKAPLWYIFGLWAN
jgi:hypothetical protein